MALFSIIEEERIQMVRAKISVTIDEELVKWVDEQIRRRRFRNRSHALEWALARVIEEERKTA